MTCFTGLPDIRAYAQSSKDAAKTQKELQSLEEQIEQERAEKAALEKDLKKSEKSVKDVRTKLVALGREVQKNEADLMALEERIAELTEEKMTLDAKFEEDRKTFSKLALSLQRLRRTPPEAMLVMPQDPLKTAQGTTVMKRVLPALRAQTEKMQNNLKDIESVMTELDSKQTTALETQEKLKKQEEEVKTLLAKRQQNFKNAQTDYKSQDAKLAKLAKEADSLQDLLETLNKEAERQAREESERTARLNASKATSAKLKNKTPPPLSPDSEIREVSLNVAAGLPRPPAPGNLITAFNETDSLGAASKGIKIKSAPGGLVVAPMGGVVRFAGPFKKYANLLIIEHKSKYHSLIGGMEDVSASVGQEISAGEPIGHLSKTKPVVYYELRKNGNPVDPSTKIKNLR